MFYGSNFTPSLPTVAEVFFCFTSERVYGVVKSVGGAIKSLITCILVRRPQRYEVVRPRRGRPPSAPRSQDLDELDAERADEAVDEEPGARVQDQDEVVEVNQALGGIHRARARGPGGHELVVEHDLVDVLQDSCHVTDDKDHDDGGQGGGIVGLVPAAKKLRCF